MFFFVFGSGDLSFSELFNSVVVVFLLLLSLVLCLWVLVSVVSSGSLGKVECGSGLDYFEYFWLCDLQDRVFGFWFFGFGSEEDVARVCVCV